MLVSRDGLNMGDVALMETLFHTANGYIGIRNCLEEDAPASAATIRGTYINAYYDIKPIAYGEKLYGFPETQQTIVNVVDVQTVKLYLGDEAFDPFTDGLISHTRMLDMAAGEAMRKVRWKSQAGMEVEITIRRMASFTQKELFLLQYEVKSLTYSGPLSFVSLQNANVSNFADPNDPRVSAQAHAHLAVKYAWSEGGATYIECSTKSSELAMVSAVHHEITKGFDSSIEHIPGCVSTLLNGSIAPGETVTLVKRCVFTDQRRHQDPALDAARIMRIIRNTETETLRKNQREYLNAFWQNARVQVLGDETLQQSMDFSVYQLLQSAGNDAVSNVAAKGLSGEGYEGHYFWDTEIYIFPFFLLTDRERAKRLLEYRHGILPSAREHAKRMGHSKGALYSWRTITGSECSGYFPSGSAQYHINGDVAHSFIQYYLATDDMAFMESVGAEVLVETARLWLDAGHMLDGAFCIDSVTGPDEYTCIVNNNYYTNAAARENLLYAAEVCNRLKANGQFDALAQKLAISDEELEAFINAGECMFLPYDKRLNIPAQDDSFLNKKILPLCEIPKENFPLLLHYHPLFMYRHQVCKQADAVLAHFLFEYLVDEAAMRRSYDYYEKITTHDSSLSACVFSIMAARLNDMDKAVKYFNKTAFMDLHNEHGNTKDGLHTANLGGAYLSIVAGFAGLRISKDGLVLRPRLPKGWQGYSFRFWYRDSLLELSVQRGSCRMKCLKGPALLIRVHDRTVHLENELEMKI